MSSWEPESEKTDADKWKAQISDMTNILMARAQNRDYSVDHRKQCAKIAATLTDAIIEMEEI